MVMSRREYISAQSPLKDEHSCLPTGIGCCCCHGYCCCARSYPWHQTRVGCTVHILDCGTQLFRLALARCTAVPSVLGTTAVSIFLRAVAVLAGDDVASKRRWCVSVSAICLHSSLLVLVTFFSCRLAARLHDLPPTPGDAIVGRYSRTTMKEMEI